MHRWIIVIAAFLITFGFVNAAIGIKALTWRFRIKTNSYSGLMLCIAIYSIGYGFELISNEYYAKLLWIHIQYIGIVFIPVFWLLLAISYIGKDKWLTGPNRSILLLIPITTLFVHYTSLRHELYYIDLHLAKNGPFTLLEYNKGPWYWVFISFMDVSVLCSNLVFLYAWLKSSSVYRKQAAIMLISSFLPWLTHFIYIFGKTPYGLDLVPFILIISSILYWYGFRGYHLNDLSPIARDLVFDVITDAILVIDKHKRLADFNDAASDLFPELSLSMSGMPIREALAGRTDIIDFIIHENNDSVMIKIDKNDESCYYNINVSNIKKNIGKIILFHNVTEQMNLLDTLQTLAVKDDLTGLYKRGHFFELSSDELALACKKKIPVSVIIMDLDHFKIVNDTYGHQAGDAVLRAIANPIQSALRATDILGRFGGEEFVAFLPYTYPNDAFHIAERLRKIIENLEVYTGEHKISTTASFGVAGLDNAENANFDKLFADADRALYEAKNAGRNLVVLNRIESGRKIQ